MVLDLTEENVESVIDLKDELKQYSHLIDDDFYCNVNRYDENIRKIVCGYNEDRSVKSAIFFTRQQIQKCIDKNVINKIYQFSVINCINNEGLVYFAFLINDEFKDLSKEELNKNILGK